MGIDPGLDGAVAFTGMTTESRAIHVPIIKNGGKKEYNIEHMARLLYYQDKSTAFVVLEKQQAYPKQGSVSTFKTGMGYGIWLGILSALNLDYVTVHPKTWQQALIPGKAGETKIRSVAMAKKLFPDVSLRISSRAKNDHDGLSDALLLAEYGRRIYKLHKATTSIDKPNRLG